MSGSTPDRLIEAAKRADGNARRMAMFKPSDSASIQDDAVRAVVAVVLREAADELFDELLSRVEPGMVVRPNIIPELLRSWAAVAEKVEPAAGSSTTGDQL